MQTEHVHVRELTAREIDQVLDESSHGHLGCRRWREVYVVPLTFIREGEFIYSHSPLGRKIKMMRNNPRVCLQVEQIRSLFNWKSVVLWGRYEELDNFEASRAMRMLVQRIALLERERGQSTLEVDLSAILNRSVIYRIKIEKSTGRAEGEMPT